MKMNRNQYAFVRYGTALLALLLTTLAFSKLPENLLHIVDEKSLVDKDNFYLGEYSQCVNC